MKYVIFASLIAVLAAETVKAPPPEPEPTPATNASTTPVPTTHAPTTLAPTTKAPTTLPPTTKTPITLPPTTKTPTTLPPTTKTSTTAAPTPPPTSTPVPPAPSPSPFPPANPGDPSTGLWSMHYGDTNSSCVILKAAIQIEFPYTENNKSSRGLVNVPTNATVEGDCKEDDKTLTLMWYYKNDTTNTTKNSLIIEFEESKDKYQVKQIKVNINPKITFADYNGTEPIVLIYNHTHFTTSSSKSYKCDKEQTLNLTENSNVTVGYLHIWHTQFQAFHNSSSQEFESAEDCEPISTSDVVPLAVGCALAALVIIVLVAYLIGRKRAQARGYLSMFSQNKKEAEYIPMKTISCFN
ncbi:lysosome-associated membrane glycoprotein 1 isoform X2 [Agrilus planipennis]|uniref:Lysosome-associated membrane glycoprotein 5 n=1 Tax=Agrilus planipennis TaxID=224129 RepID=A0A7F5R9L8_AGRPL|nr:lysosome-associated membrane glycoprotein 1 isoform X2 [Agrilus planipennis]